MIKLYLDENIPEAIAIALRLRGYDVLTVKEANLKGLSDKDQLIYATKKGRALVTFNVADFVKLHNEFIKSSKAHKGIILSKQLHIGLVIKGLIKLLNNINKSSIENNIIWLNKWIETP